MVDDLSDRLLGGLNRIGLAMRSAAWGEAAESGLTPTQCQILVFIAGHLSQHPRSGDAANALGITPQTASVAISALVAKGLVQKVQDNRDRRARGLRLTRHGEVAARVAAQWPDFMLNALQELEATERTLLLNILIKIIWRLQRHGHIAPQRLCVTCRHFIPTSRPEHRSAPLHCNHLNVAMDRSDMRLDCHHHNAVTPEAADGLWLKLQLELAPSATK